MNKLFFSILLVGGLALSLGSCSSGTYVTNPNSNANGSVNPLNPLTASQFSWPASTHKVSLNYNGAAWSTDSAGVYYDDSLRTNIIWAYGSGRSLILYVQYGWASTVYNMGFKQYNNLGVWAPDSASFYQPYQSALGNSGGLYMTSNDTVNFCGKFYFQAVNDSGLITNISNGVFTLTK